MSVSCLRCCRFDIKTLFFLFNENVGFIISDITNIYSIIMSCVCEHYGVLLIWDIVFCVAMIFSL